MFQGLKEINKNPLNNSVDHSYKVNKHRKGTINHPNKANSLDGSFEFENSAQKMKKFTMKRNKPRGIDVKSKIHQLNSKEAYLMNKKPKRFKENILHKFM